MFGLSFNSRRSPMPEVWRRGRAKRSNVVSHRTKDTGTLRGSIDKLGDGTVAGLAVKLGPVLGEGETLPDFSLALELVVRTVEAALERLDKVDHRYRAAAMMRHRARQECERVARRELNPVMRQVRKTAEALYGKEAGQQLHEISGKTLRKPGRVLRQAREMIATLENQRRKLPLPAPELPAHLEEWLGLIQSSATRWLDLAGGHSSSATEWPGNSGVRSSSATRWPGSFFVRQSSATG